MKFKKLSFTILSLFFTYSAFAQFDGLPDGLLPEQAIIDEWDNGMWVEQAQLNTTYNTNCQPLVREISISALVFNRITYTYNAQDELIETVTESFTGFGLENTARSVFTITNGLVTEEIQYTWDGFSWQLSQRLLFTYNAQDVLTEQVTQIWDIVNSIWVNDARTQYTLDGSGMITEELFEDWDPVGTSWVNNNRTTYTFNGSNQETESIRQQWDIPGMMWVNQERSTSTYSSGNLSEVIYQIWNGSSWVNDENDIYTYNTNQQVESVEYGSWNGSSFDPSSRDLYSYDMDGRISEIIDQDYISNNWENATRISLSYPSCLALSITESSLSDYSIYPNPAQSEITIRNQLDTNDVLNFIIYDISGRMVKKGNMIGAYGTVDINNLNSGLYLVQLITNSSTSTKQLLIN